MRFVALGIAVAVLAGRGGAPTSAPVRGCAHTREHLRLNTLAAIDPLPGLEVVVDVEHGASTAFVGVFGLRSGLLVRLRRAGRWEDQFASAGSLRCFSAVDCVGPRASGRIVASGGGRDPKGSSWSDGSTGCAEASSASSAPPDTGWRPTYAFRFTNSGSRCRSRAAPSCERGARPARARRSGPAPPR